VTLALETLSRGSIDRRLLPRDYLLGVGPGDHRISLPVDRAVDRFEVGLEKFWNVVNHLHVAADLTGYLLEDFLAEVATRDSLLEPHELHDIALGLSILVVFEQLVIRVQLDHHFEVLIAHAHDNH